VELIKGWDLRSKFQPFILSLWLFCIIKFMKSSLFFTIVVALLIGMISGMFVLPDNILHYWWIGIAGAILWQLFCSYRFDVKSRIGIIVLFLVCICIGFWRTNEFHQRYPFTAFDHFNNQTITLLGIIDQTPTLKPGIQSVRVRPEFINGEKFPKKTQDIIIKFSDLENFAVGDHLSVTGKFFVRSNFQSDTGRVVQYRLMSYGRKIAGDMQYPKLIHFASANHNTWNLFASIKKKFISTLNQLFIAPASGLLSGIIIGDTSSLENNLLDIFRAVGLIHIVVLSGYNITLVANFFVRLFAPLGYYRRLVTAMFALVLFICIVGISPTSLRAGIMALCAFSARYFLRPYAVTRGIFLALVIMVWISPYTLLFDLSLQLSFLATIGIVYLFPKLSLRFPRLAENTLGEILLQTVAVNILTLPIIIYQMGTFSFISFPVNILILGFIPWVTILGFGAIFIGMIIEPLGRIMAFPVQIIVQWIIQIARWTALHDPFRVSLPAFSYGWIIVMYAVMIVRLLRRVRAS
jgi:competence protein ComEC